MAGNQRTPIGFGGGLDRNAGTAKVDPEAFYDLRNVHLTIGKMWPRMGMSSTTSFTSDDAILAIYPIRSSGIGAIVTYRISDRTVRLYIVSADGTSQSAIGVIWTLPTNPPFPQVSITDSYNKIFIAHDQSDITIRQQTVYYDTTTGSVSNVVADLDNSGSNHNVLFRGVQRYLGFLVGWGFGTDSDKDRPEVVRISLPGDPTHFNPEHLFYAGQRGEPVVTCHQAGDILAVFKDSETFAISGTDRQTFTINPMDRTFGCIGSRLALSMNGVVFFWSAEGPRITDGTPSKDAAFPLDLGGPSPSASATAAVIDNGFVCYLPEKRELQFIFGKWGYVLHLRDPGNERWSYRDFPIELNAAGLLYPGPFAGTVGPGSADYPSWTSASSITSTSATINWGNNGTITGCTVEIWGKRYDTGTWSMVGSVAAAGASQSLACTLLNGMSYDFALRYKKNNVYNSAYSSANPADWPSVSRSSSTTTTTMPTPTISSITWSRTSGTVEQMAIVLAAAPQSHVNVVIDPQGGASGETLTGQSSTTVITTDGSHTHWAGETSYTWRIKYTTAYVTGSNSGTSTKWTGPVPCTSVLAYYDHSVGSEDVWRVSWNNNGLHPAVVEIESDGNSGGSSWYLADTVNTTGTGAQDNPLDSSTGSPTFLARLRHKLVQFSVADYSSKVVG